jgi:Flp pilus assembly protein TadB
VISLRESLVAGAVIAGTGAAFFYLRDGSLTWAVGLALAAFVGMAAEDLRIWRNRETHPNRSPAARQYFDDNSGLSSPGNGVLLALASLFLIGFSLADRTWGGVLVGLFTLVVGAGLTFSRVRTQRKLDAESEG